MVLQGFQVWVDDLTGFGCTCSAVLDHLLEDYTKTAILACPIRCEQQPLQVLFICIDIWHVYIWLSSFLAVIAFSGHKLDNGVPEVPLSVLLLSLGRADQKQCGLVIRS